MAFRQTIRGYVDLGPSRCRPDVCHGARALTGGVSMPFLRTPSPLSRDCPKCGAAAGFDCVSVAGTGRHVEAHAERQARL